MDQWFGGRIRSYNSWSKIGLALSIILVMALPVQADARLSLKAKRSVRLKELAYTPVGGAVLSMPGPAFTVPSGLALTITNVGTAAAKDLIFAFDNPGSEDMMGFYTTGFMIGTTGTCGSTLSAGLSCTIEFYLVHSCMNFTCPPGTYNHTDTFRVSSSSATTVSISVTDGFVVDGGFGEEI